MVTEFSTWARVPQ